MCRPSRDRVHSTPSPIWLALHHLTSTCGFLLRRWPSGATAASLSFAWPKANGCRVLLASTSEIYGDPLERPQREEYWGNVNPIGPRSVYDESKRYAEALFMAHRRPGRSTPASSGSSTPTALVCVPTMAGSCPTSSRRHCKVNR